MNDNERYRRFCEEVATSLTNVQVQILPLPLQLLATTARGAIFKVQQWVGKGNQLNPENWEVTQC